MVCHGHPEPLSSTDPGGLHERDKERDERLQKAIDHINKQYGKTALKVATQVLNTDKPLTKKEKLSPCYTTNLRDILVLKC